MTTQAFLAAVAAIAAEKPAYRLGGTGTDGTCDCIGLIMGAINRVQAVHYPLHSSNYFARWQTEELQPLSAAALIPGMLVYKARRDNGSLNPRYRDGGSFCNGDPLDYYHAGVVTRTGPLEITHCTSGGTGGITIDSSAKGWSHMGRLTDLQEKEEMSMTEPTLATVTTQDGNPLKLRPGPNTEKPPIAKMPNGSTVQVYADAEGWAKVVYQGQTGYCMSRFLTYPSGSTASGWMPQLLYRLDRIIALLGGDTDG